MPGRTLLTTTALVLCISTSLAGQKADLLRDRIKSRLMILGEPRHIVHGIPLAVMTRTPSGRSNRNNIPLYQPNDIFDNFSRDRNAQFISWYGFVAMRESSCISSAYCLVEVGTNAIPITGTGTTVKRIGVPIASLTGPNTEFNVGIYSATPSGLPGDTELAGGLTTASDTKDCCTATRWVRVNVTLEEGKKYFVEVACASSETDCLGSWNMEDVDFSGDSQDYWRRQILCTGANCTSNYSTECTCGSSWRLSTYYPTEPAAIVR